MRIIIIVEFLNRKSILEEGLYFWTSNLLCNIRNFAPIKIPSQIPQTLRDQIPPTHNESIKNEKHRYLLKYIDRVQYSLLSLFLPFMLIFSYYAMRSIILIPIRLQLWSLHK